MDRKHWLEEATEAARRFERELPSEASGKPFVRDLAREMEASWLRDMLRTGGDLTSPVPVLERDTDEEIAGTLGVGHPCLRHDQAASACDVLNKQAQAFRENKYSLDLKLQEIAAADREQAAGKEPEST